MAQMRRGMVQAMRELGGFDEEAAVIEAKRSDMTLGLIYLLRSHGVGLFPVSTAELMERPVSTAEIKERLEIPVSEALAMLR